MRRRGFLRFLAGSATVVATSSASGLLLESRRYCNTLLGFEFAKPESWHYLSYQEYSDAGKDVLDSYDVLKALRDSQGDPLVSVAQYYRAPPLVTPSIVVFGEVPEIPWSEDDIFQRDFADFGKELDGFVLEAVDVPLQFGDTAGACTTYSYDYVAAGSNYRMRTRCIVLLHQGVVLTFNFTSLDGSDDKVLQALADSEASIRLFGVPGT